MPDKNTFNDSNHLNDLDIGEMLGFVPDLENNIKYVDAVIKVSDLCSDILTNQAEHIDVKGLDAEFAILVRNFPYFDDIIHQKVLNKLKMCKAAVGDHILDSQN